MKKIYGILAILLISITSVNAAGLNICDINNDGVSNLTDVGYFATIVSWFQNKDIRMDLNQDGVINLSDISILATHMREPTTWCHDTFWYYFEVPTEKSLPTKASPIAKEVAFNQNPGK
ncbi:hypothetical protein CO037_02655 [Candidatus Pacearchaeota archaeon CG_4_9_14_0_2_um_filter_30_8]|nr:MAG: hypothetical protein CO037_02655 [Candidatus Pacearchaeota archaeon CG_4_9_14_0_2_um_filter_30_8]